MKQAEYSDFAAKAVASVSIDFHQGGHGEAHRLW